MTNVEKIKHMKSDIETYELLRNKSIERGDITNAIACKMIIIGIKKSLIKIENN